MFFDIVESHIFDVIRKSLFNLLIIHLFIQTLFIWYLSSVTSNRGKQ